MIAAGLILVSACGLILEADVSPDSTASRSLGWLKGGRADPTAPLDLVIALSLPQAGVEELKRVLAAVSDPKNEAYGQHKTNDEVHSLVAPSPASIASVKAHLESHGIRTATAATPNSDMILARATVREAEAALGCEYFEYTHRESGLRALRTPRYSLPASVRGAVDFVAPTVRLPSTASPRAKLDTSSSSAGLLGNSPKSLRKLYNVGDAVGQAADNRQAVTGFLGQHFSQRDLDVRQRLSMTQTPTLTLTPTPALTLTPTPALTL